MENSKLLRRAAVLLLLLWMRVNAERDIQCNGRSFECEGAYHFITCVNLPDGQRLYIPNRCKPGTICNNSNHPSEPCDSDAAPPTTLSTAPTSTADVPTTLGQRTTSPYVRPTVGPSGVFSEKTGELNVFNDTGLLPYPKYNEFSAVNVSFGVNISNNYDPPANASVNVTASIGLESPSVIKSSSVITLSKSGNSNLLNGFTLMDKKSSVVETNTTIQKLPSSPQSSQFIINMLTQAFFQFDEVRSQSVISFTSSQGLNLSGSTVSINVATGVSDGGDSTNGITLTTNTTVSFGQHDEHSLEVPAVGEIQEANDRPDLQLTQVDSARSVNDNNALNSSWNPKASDEATFVKVNITKLSGDDSALNMSHLLYSFNKSDFETENTTLEPVKERNDIKNFTVNNEVPEGFVILDLLVEESGSGQPDFLDITQGANIITDLLAEGSGEGQTDYIEISPENSKNINSEQPPAVSSGVNSTSRTSSTDRGFDEVGEWQKVMESSNLTVSSANSSKFHNSTIISMVKDDRLIPVGVSGKGIPHEVPSTVHSALQNSPVLFESLPTFNSEDIIHENELFNKKTKGNSVSGNKTVNFEHSNERGIQIPYVDFKTDSPILNSLNSLPPATIGAVESFAFAQSNDEGNEAKSGHFGIADSNRSNNLDSTSNFAIEETETESSPLSTSTSFSNGPIETQVETTIVPLFESFRNEGEGKMNNTKVTANSFTDDAEKKWISDDTLPKVTPSSQASNKTIILEKPEYLSPTNKGVDQDMGDDEAEHSLAANNSFYDKLMVEVVEGEQDLTTTINVQDVDVTPLNPGKNSNNVDMESPAVMPTLPGDTNEATTVDYTTESIVPGLETTFTNFIVEEETNTDAFLTVPALQESTLDTTLVPGEDQAQDPYNNKSDGFNALTSSDIFPLAENITYFTEEETENLTGTTISSLFTIDEQSVRLVSTFPETGDKVSTIPSEESTLSPNWPNLGQVNPHPVVSETTFDLKSTGGPIVSQIPEDILTNPRGQLDETTTLKNSVNYDDLENITHKPSSQLNLKNGTHTDILDADSDDPDLRKRELGKTTENLQAKGLGSFDKNYFAAMDSTNEKSIQNLNGKSTVDNLQTTVMPEYVALNYGADTSRNTAQVPTEALNESSIQSIIQVNSENLQQVNSAGSSSVQLPAELATSNSTVISEAIAASITQRTNNFEINSTLVDGSTPQIPSVNSSLARDNSQLLQTSSPNANRSASRNEISTGNPSLIATTVETTTMVSEDPLDPTTEETYTTLFPTRAPSIISVVTQTNVPEPVEPSVDVPLISEPLNVSDEQVALASNGDSGSNITREPFICTDHGVFPDVYDCKQYFLCVNQPGGYVKITGVCPSRFAFNFDIQRCVRDVSSCYNDKCTKEGNYTDPVDDTSYFWCNEVTSGVFHKYHLQCDPPMKFMQDLNMCGNPNNLESAGFVVKNGTEQNSNGTRLEDFKIETTAIPGDIEQFPPTVLIETKFREMPATTNKYETAFIESFPIEDQNAVLSDPVGKTIQADDNPTELSRTVRSLSERSLFRCRSEGIYGHPSNCSQYYMCVRNAFNGITAILRNCPERYAYRPDIKGCSRDLSGCVSLHVHCKGVGNFANPEDESSYYRCVPNVAGGLRIYSIKCEGLQMFDSAKGACTTAENHVSSSSLPLPGSEMESLASEPNKNSKRSTVEPLSEQQTKVKVTYLEPVASEGYRKEAEGRLREILDVMRDEAARQHEVKMEEKRYFDKIEEDDDEVDSDEEAAESFTILVTALRNDQSDRNGATNSEFRCREEGRFPDPTNCKMYYICSARRTEELKLHHLECRGSDRFDARKRICVDGEDASCA